MGATDKRPPYKWSRADSSVGRGGLSGRSAAQTSGGGAGASVPVPAQPTHQLSVEKEAVVVVVGLGVHRPVTGVAR